MFKIDSPGNVGNQFSDGTPGVTPATIVSDEWLNAVQGELVASILAAGITLDKTNSAQLLAAIKKLSRPNLLATYVTYAKTDLSFDGAWHTLTVDGVPSTAEWMYVGGFVENHGGPDDVRQSLKVRPSAARSGQTMEISRTNGTNNYENDHAIGPILVPCDGAHLDYTWSDNVTYTSLIIYGYL